MMRIVRLCGFYDTKTHRKTLNANMKNAKQTNLLENWDYKGLGLTKFKRLIRRRRYEVKASNNVLDWKTPSEKSRGRGRPTSALKRVLGLGVEGRESYSRFEKSEGH